jgi:predicted DCC family thiol-disulfide oxidoreductase YuxK
MVKFGALQKHRDLLIKHAAGRYAEGGEEELSTVVVIQGGNVYVRSEAALRVLAVMDQPFRTLSVLSIIPVSLRDVGYKFVAANRYWVFGKSESCRAPNERFESRFLEYVPQNPLAF